MKSTENESSLNSMAGSNSMAWSGCHKTLVIEWAGKPPGLADLLKPKKSFFLEEWASADVFVMRLGESPGCQHEYKAACAIGALVVKESCNGKPVDKELPNLPLGKSKVRGRKTSVNFGDVLFLNLPKLSGGTCKVPLSEGAYVKTYAMPKKEQDSIPYGKELAQVAAGAAMMADGNECGEGAMEIHRDPSNSARALAQLAGYTRVEADKIDDSGTQALHLLLELHFQERSAQFSQPMPPVPAGKSIRTLAQDFRSMQSMQSGVRLPNITMAADTTGMIALSHYYTGLASFPPQKGKPRALIFTCSFGDGHKSAASAVSSYLTSARFETHTIDTTYTDEFHDPLNVLAANMFNDFILKRQHYKTFNVMDILQQLVGTLSKPCPSPTCNSRRKQQFRTAILNQRPDIIVTVYHMELVPVLESAKELGNIPVLHVATDIDIKAKEVFSHKDKPVYPKFLLGVPFELEASYGTIAPLQQEQTFLSGYPVRATFLRPFDEVHVAAEKAKFVPKGTKLMLIMSGGGGQNVQWPYKLAKRGIGIPVHIVVIAGGNNALAPKMRASMPFDKTFPDGRVVWHGNDETVTFEIAKDPSNTQEDKPYYVFEERLALLMDMADVMLSKPGGGSTAEAAYRGAPTVFDVSGGLLRWEQFTVDVFTRARRGIASKSGRNFRGAILAAMGLGRSRALAKDANGEIINTKDRIVEAAESLLAMQCS